MRETPGKSEHFRAETMFSRFLQFGVAYGDLVRITAESSDWTTWSYKLNSAAETYLSMAINASEVGTQVSAAHFFRLATIYFHYSQIRIPVSDIKMKRRSQTAQAFRSWLKASGEYARLLDVPFGKIKLPGYLLGQDSSAPLVILIGGLDSAKEVELYTFAQEFRLRGMQCYIFDGPGQGELFTNVPLDLRFELVLPAVVDYLIDYCSASEVGVFGVSLGGHLAARATAADDRIRGCISIGGFYDTGTLAHLPALAAETLRHALAIQDDTSLEQMINGASVADASPHMSRPLFVIHGTNDHLVHEDQMVKFEKWARGNARIWRMEGAEHVCTDRFPECLPVMGDWMKEILTTNQKSAGIA
ncbi:MAG TPA: alpha/beta hydrolase [Candidatus Angelobacter sp.]|jgi:pimeloyl-ACP methyl ester carboxylesterase|nr:alpha/beta hydrolase [Candidatus Angelobacter sp.]